MYIHIHYAYLYIENQVEFTIAVMYIINKESQRESLMSVLTILAIYFIAINLIGFFSIGIDKQKAKKRTFRIPEATLFTIAIIGGSLGSIIGMNVFRHKTQRRLFLIGMPAILLIHILLLAFLTFGPYKIVLF